MSRPRIVPIIMSGGAGTRLWPLSRELFPKQFHALTDPAESVFQKTLRRIGSRFAAPIIVSNEQHRFLVAAQLQEASVAPMAHILEPVPRSTAMAIACAALHPTIADDDLILPLATDHFVADDAAFCDAVETAAAAAAMGRLVAFGIRPARPETGYGYIAMGDAIPGLGPVCAIDRFIEKPSRQSAEALVAEPQNLWNQGIFLFSKRTILDELGEHAPGVLRAADRAMSAAKFDTDFCRPDAEAFARASAISIDYAVMEQTKRGAVMPVSYGWSDIGTWDALWRAQAKDPAGNVVSGDVRLVDAQDSYIRADAGLVAALGVKDLVIVASGDAVMVAPRDRAHEVGKLVDALREGRRREIRNHLLVHRLWGHFLTLAEGPGYQVKILVLKPGASISLQFHTLRAERWVVVEGEAEVTLGETKQRLTAHQAVDIGVGMIHQLSNPGESPLKVIEVQSGPYLGEDDIVRLS